MKNKAAVAACGNSGVQRDKVQTTDCCEGAAVIILYEWNSVGNNQSRTVGGASS